MKSKLEKLGIFILLNLVRIFIGGVIIMGVSLIVVGVSLGLIEFVDLGLKNICIVLFVGAIFWLVGYPFLKNEKKCPQLRGQR